MILGYLVLIEFYYWVNVEDYKAFYCFLHIISRKWLKKIHIKTTVEAVHGKGRLSASKPRPRSSIHLFCYFKHIHV